MSKKRQIIQVDEEKLKMMMAGDIPMKVEPGDLTIIEEENGKSKPDLQKEEKDIPVQEKPNPTEDRVNKKRKTGKDKYMELFLSKPPVKLRRQRTIMFEEELYLKISRLVKNLPREVSFPNFLINVMNHHFEVYQDDIDEIMRMIINDMYNPK
jgi:hypothetical protein